jgi:hypothetical protein
MKTWKLKRRPLDVKCAGVIKNQHVPNILQISARHHDSLLAKTSPYFLSLLKKGLRWHSLPSSLPYELSGGAPFKAMTMAAA